MRCTVSARVTSQQLPISNLQLPKERLGIGQLGVGSSTSAYFFAVFAGFGASAFTAVATIELPSIR